MLVIDLCMKVKHQNLIPLKLHVCQLSLNMQTQISLNTLKLHNERLDKLLVRLEENFGWKPIHPKEDVQTIMYRAGQASVIEYIKSIMDFYISQFTLACPALYIIVFMSSLGWIGFHPKFSSSLVISLSNLSL